MKLSQTLRSAEKKNAAARVPRTTIADRLRRWAKERPLQHAYVYATERGDHALTYAELDRRARAIARSLATRSAPGSTALLLYPLGLDFVAAFFGCLYARIIAVPLHPGRGKAAGQRLRTVAHDCGARIALTTSSVAADVLDTTSALDGVEVFATDRLALDQEELTAHEFSPPASDAIAFLQYTSGSTTEPRGTVVSHANISANQSMLASAIGTDASTVIVSWLPVFHDMGLIGNVLHSAHLGATTVLVPTLGFLKSPVVWLRTIQRYRADVSGAPNFAYDLCVDKITPAERAGLDLASWRVAFNGAEPVRERTLERFAATFAPCGFRKSAFVPTYGLAEATLMVSGNRGSGPSYLRVDERALRDRVVAAPATERAAKVLVGNGSCEFADQVVAIVDPVSGQRCSADAVGEIWVSGSHVARGYWRNEAKNGQTFGARLPGEARRYLRTGDLGFLRDGALYVTGRLKDLLIFRGQNVYPQDIELTLELALPEVRPGATAAFASDEETAGVVVVAELERGNVPTADELARVARQLRESHEIPLRHLVLVRRNTVPKTTSGKIQRQKCKTEYERGEYVALAAWQSETSAPSATLAREIRDFAAAWIARDRGLPLDAIEDTANVAAYGVDSIRKVALVSALELEFDVVVPETSFFAIECIDDLARVVSTSQGRSPCTGEQRSDERQASNKTRDPVLPAFSPMSWESDDD
jgi:acyl-CoA synthetase (AMP-forming)/AMP-acid ligase II/acyl carrier protein